MTKKPVLLNELGRRLVALVRLVSSSVPQGLLQRVDY